MSVRSPHPDDERTTALEMQSDAERALLEAKLGPRARPGAVARPRLTDRLVASEAYQLVVISAPVGFGKATLLASWAQQDSRPFAWVSLEPADDDPIVLFTAIASSLSRVQRVDPGLFVALATPGISVLGRVVPRVLAALQSADGPVVLVLRNLHEVRSQESRDAIDLLVDNLPPRAQIAVSSRQSVWLATASRRGRGELLELGPTELAFDEQEAAQLVEAAGVTVDRAEVRRLVASTEGWAAGIYLDSLALRNGGSPRSVAEFVHPFVSAYVRSEVLAHLPGPELQMLKRTSILEMLSGPLCDAVLATSGSARRLASIAGSNLFVTPLGDKPDWYHVHSLFRAVLLDELVHTEPRLMATLHCRAADWWEENGSVGQAVRHYCAGGEPDRAARLVANELLPAYTSGRLSAVEEWLRELGEPVIERTPTVAVLAGWIAALTGRPIEAARWADVADRVPTHDLTPEAGASFESIRAMLKACLCADGVAGMAADAELTVTQVPPWSSWRAVAVGLLAVAHSMEGDRESANLLFAEAIEAAQATGTPAVLTRMLAHRALLAADRHDWARASDDIEHGLRVILEHGLGEYGTVALLYAAAARIHLHRQHINEARTALLHAMRLRPQSTWAIAWSAVPLRLEMAAAHLALSDPEGARILLSEVDEILHHRPKLEAFDDRVAALRAHLVAARHTPNGSTLTAAELRVLPYLQTHLTLGQIADRLYVSRNTVSAQSGSIYRKLGVTSRSEAVAGARELGLLATDQP